MAKERLDILLVKRNLIDSREKAKRLIMAGLVFSNDLRLDKPGMKVDETIPLTVKEVMPYVGRGGYKLEKALNTFDVHVNDKIVVDIGASTGGFTDCALQNGAKLVYAIDVGYNQLAWKLRNDPRVIVYERTNFRYVTEQLFTQGLPNFATIDVSFISLRLILPVLKQLLQKDSDIVALIKPQFEAEKGQVGKKGVIRDQKIHIDVIKKIIDFSIAEGFNCLNVTYSPITGGEGNIEYLIHLHWGTLQSNAEKFDGGSQMIQTVVSEAHDELQ